MFDVGFWELCLIAVVALLILGPERLPTAARTAGKWVGKIRGMVSNVKQEIDRELQLDEIRRKMQDQEQALREKSGLDDIQDALDMTIAEMEPLQQSISPSTETDKKQSSTDDEVNKDQDEQTRG